MAAEPKNYISEITLPNNSSYYISDSEAAKMYSTQVTLVASNWRTEAQTGKIYQIINISGLTSTDNIVVSPAPTSIEYYTSKKVYCSQQSSSGNLTFVCSDIPSINIVVNILVLRNKEDFM